MALETETNSNQNHSKSVIVGEKISGKAKKIM